jgi:hypothetical protein
VAAPDELGHLAEEEGEQERADVRLPSTSASVMMMTLP